MSSPTWQQLPYPPAPRHQKPSPTPLRATKREFENSALGVFVAEEVLVDFVTNTVRDFGNLRDKYAGLSEKLVFLENATASGNFPKGLTIAPVDPQAPGLENDPEALAALTSTLREIEKAATMQRVQALSATCEVLRNKVQQDLCSLTVSSHTYLKNTLKEVLGGSLIEEREAVAVVCADARHLVSQKLQDREDKKAGSSLPPPGE